MAIAKLETDHQSFISNPYVPRSFRLDMSLNSNNVNVCPFETDWLDQFHDFIIWLQTFVHSLNQMFPNNFKKLQTRQVHRPDYNMPV